MVLKSEKHAHDYSLESFQTANPNKYFSENHVARPCLNISARGAPLLSASFIIGKWHQCETETYQFNRTLLISDSYPKRCKYIFLLKCAFLSIRLLFTKLKYIHFFNSIKCDVYVSIVQAEDFQFVYN
jgi:hypothetical protein